jgi:hypothetical protein
MGGEKACNTTRRNTVVCTGWDNSIGDVEGPFSEIEPLREDLRRNMLKA